MIPQAGFKLWTSFRNSNSICLRFNFLCNLFKPRASIGLGMIRMIWRSVMIPNIGLVCKSPFETSGRYWCWWPSWPKWIPVNFRGSDHVIGATWAASNTKTMMRQLRWNMTPIWRKWHEVTWSNKDFALCPVLFDVSSLLFRVLACEHG